MQTNAEDLKADLVALDKRYARYNQQIKNLEQELEVMKQSMNAIYRLRESLQLVIALGEHIPDLEEKTREHIKGLNEIQF